MAHTQHRIPETLLTRTQGLETSYKAKSKVNPFSKSPYLHGWALPCCWPAGRDVVAAAPRRCRAHSAPTSCACSAPPGSSESPSPQAEACGSFLKSRKIWSFFPKRNTVENLIRTGATQRQSTISHNSIVPTELEVPSCQRLYSCSKRYHYMGFRHTYEAAKPPSGHGEVHKTLMYNFFFHLSLKQQALRYNNMKFPASSLRPRWRRTGRMKEFRVLTLSS